MHKIFISYHHANEQAYKDYMISHWDNKIFINNSVDTGDINENLSPRRIREIIRDDYLRDTSVTIVLVGKCTKHRKHVDWEIGSSMIDGKLNKKSGIVIIETKSIATGMSSGIGSQRIRDEIGKVRNATWISSDTKDSIRHPNLPAKLLENVDRSDVEIPILQWDDVANNPMVLYEAIEFAYQKRKSNNYFVSEFRKHDNNSCY